MKNKKILRAKKRHEKQLVKKQVELEFLEVKYEKKRTD